MKHILNWLASLAADKYLHFIAGLIIASFFYITLGMEVCLVPVIAAGFIKEFIDGWRYGGFCGWDLLATVLGGAVIQIFVMIS